mgnify:CR=1 FL=1
MPMLKRPDGEIYYEVRGQGYPVLCLAPGWLNSAIGMWPFRASQPYAWADWPKALAEQYQVIVMDQRNANGGQSKTAIKANHGWHTYEADHLALIDHLDLKRFHVVGVCIGSSFALRLCRQARSRISSMLLPQPIGLDPAAPRNFMDRYAKWSEAKLKERPDLDAKKLAAFGSNMFDGDFVFSATRSELVTNPIPSMVMPGSLCWRRAISGWASSVSPTQLGATIRKRGTWASVPLGRCALVDIPGTAIRAQRLAGFFNRHKHARVRVPKQHRRCRAVQRQIGRGNFNVP